MLAKHDELYAPEIADVVAEAHAEARLKTGVVTGSKWGWRLMVPEFGHFALTCSLSKLGVVCTASIRGCSKRCEFNA